MKNSALALTLYVNNFRLAENEQALLPGESPKKGKEAQLVEMELFFVGQMTFGYLPGRVPGSKGTNKHYCKKNSHKIH